MIKFIFIMLPALAIASGCARPQGDGEITAMTKTCFEKHQGIIIKFEPQPENKQEQEIK
jgi:hypothetical protein